MKGPELESEVTVEAGDLMDAEGRGREGREKETWMEIGKGK